jgi:hypothetical protein
VTTFGSSADEIQPASAYGGGQLPELDRDMAEEFLAALDPKATKWTFQTFDDNADRKDEGFTQVLNAGLGFLWSTLARRNRQGAGIFVTVNQTDLGGRTASSITRIRALFIDLDRGGPLPTFHCQPHIIVESSRGKWHVYWLVTDCEIKQFEAWQRRLVSHYGGDPKIVDPSRVLRIPGFIHRKVKDGIASEPFLSRLVEAHDHDPYTVEEFEIGLPGEDKKGEGNGAAEPNANGKGHDDQNWYERQGDSQSKSGPKAWTPANEAKLRSALARIPTEKAKLDAKLGDSHKVWVNIGRALERLDWDEKGFAIWRDWCAGNADKFDEKGLRTQWASFRRNRDKETDKPVTIGTIYWYAEAFEQGGSECRRCECRRAE